MLFAIASSPQSISECCSIRACGNVKHSDLLVVSLLALMMVVVDNLCFLSLSI